MLCIATIETRREAVKVSQTKMLRSRLLRLSARRRPGGLRSPAGPEASAAGTTSPGSTVGAPTGERRAWNLAGVWRRGRRSGSATTGGGVTAPIRRRIISCRRRSRALGWPGSNTRGLVIAPASSADSCGPSSAADLPK